MNMYCYNSIAPLGQESLGTEGRHLFSDLKTLNGAKNRMKKFGYKHFSVYSYTNFYVNETFKLLYKQ